MPDIGPAELVVILVVVLVILGPSRLPEVARGLGAAIREFRKALRGEETPEAGEDDGSPQADGGTRPRPPE
ncbi:MAG TPA: twin-arginine translocase TatA/TatE family subunit [Dehalococcoidia bacterium]|nr:twin-arginine translocase TatA/TatE family subunit [Dehalococcoidia bacterium]